MARWAAIRQLGSCGRLTTPWTAIAATDGWGWHPRGDSRAAEFYGGGVALDLAAS